MVLIKPRAKRKEGKQMKAIIDKILTTYVSKKLTVFFIATLLVVSSKISGAEWVNIAAIYIGSQAVIDAVVKLRK